MTGNLRWVWAMACLVFLAGCAGSGEPTGSAGALSEGYEGALPVQTQLIVGTLQLEESETAVTREQAAELIPLWKAVRSLSSSDTAAQAELEALTDQVQETMTAEQLQAIAAMQLTQEDLFGVMQELGIGPGGAAEGDQVFRFDGGQASGEGQASGGGPPEGFVLEGGPPEGFQGGGPGGGGQFSSQDLDPDQIATLQAERGGQAPGGGRAGLFLIEPLLEMLETKAGA